MFFIKSYIRDLVNEAFTTLGKAEKCIKILQNTGYVDWIYLALANIVMNIKFPESTSSI